MRYRIADRVVRSENAAKPQAQKSEFVRELLSALPEVGKTLDYGCGKLRYLNEIAERSAEVFLLDSQPQLYRIQKIAGVRTSVAEIASRSNSIHLFDLKLAARSAAIFDRVLCVNVLSAIPIPAIRAEILRRTSRLLVDGGEFVITHQYRNSDFTRMRKLGHASEFRDGFIVDSLRGPSFYSTMSVADVKALAANANLKITDSILNDGTVALLGVKQAA